ncbi:hypothetical protein KQY30_20180 [Streptomyces sp. GMY02]|uniref:hypothetical protein n=1 Tax=Streptomyces sp. GMY02 TaxID=1333528 RepID=UPI001C2BE7ED|nr:hypothetical protein [Streptomyces sp. GMY02]QXE36217.1 hypothetical protein KQY30_20180 [Streptomyces sp. GMY02]
MPTAADHLPAGPTSLSRRLTALEREVRELRAARRAAHTAVATGGIRLVDAAGDILAELVADRNGSAAFVTYDTRSGVEYYAALAAGDISFGISGATRTEDEGRLSFADVGDGRYETLLSSGGAAGATKSLLTAYSATAPGAADSRIDVTTDRVAVSGLLTAANIVTGSAVITPSAANVPTSVAVGGLSLPGTVFIALATAATAAPGSNVTGVGVTAATASGFTLWLTRTNTTATTVNWMVISK